MSSNVSSNAPRPHLFSYWFRLTLPDNPLHVTIDLVSHDIVSKWVLVSSLLTIGMLFIGIYLEGFGAGQGYGPPNSFWFQASTPCTTSSTAQQEVNDTGLETLIVQLQLILQALLLAYVTFFNHASSGCYIWVVYIVYLWQMFSGIGTSFTNVGKLVTFFGDIEAQEQLWSSDTSLRHNKALAPYSDPDACITDSGFSLPSFLHSLSIPILKDFPLVEPYRTPILNPYYLFLNLASMFVALLFASALTVALLGRLALALTQLDSSCVAGSTAGGGDRQGKSNSKGCVWRCVHWVASLTHVRTMQARNEEYVRLLLTTRSPHAGGRGGGRGRGGAGAHSGDGKGLAEPLLEGETRAGKEGSLGSVSSDSDMEEHSGAAYSLLEEDGSSDGDASLTFSVDSLRMSDFHVKLKGARQGDDFSIDPLNSRRSKSAYMRRGARGGCVAWTRQASDRCVRGAKWSVAMACKGRMRKREGGGQWQAVTDWRWGAGEAGTIAAQRAKQHYEKTLSGLPPRVLVAVCVSLLMAAMVSIMVLLVTGIAAALFSAVFPLIGEGLPITTCYNYIVLLDLAGYLSCWTQQEYDYENILTDVLCAVTTRISPLVGPLLIRLACATFIVGMSVPCFQVWRMTRDFRRHQVQLHCPGSKGSSHEGRMALLGGKPALLAASSLPSNLLWNTFMCCMLAHILGFILGILWLLCNYAWFWDALLAWHTLQYSLALYAVIFLSQAALNAYLTSGYTIKGRFCFGLVDFLFIVFSVPSTIFAAVKRLGKTSLVMVLELPRLLDTRGRPVESYRATLALAWLHGHPILRCFASLLLQELRRGGGGAATGKRSRRILCAWCCCSRGSFADQPRPERSAAAAASRRARTRWHLALLLARNPSLRRLRKHRLLLPLAQAVCMCMSGAVRRKWRRVELVVTSTCVLKRDLKTNVRRRISNQQLQVLAHTADPRLAIMQGDSRKWLVKTSTPEELQSILAAVRGISSASAQTGPADQP